MVVTELVFLPSPASDILGPSIPPAPQLHGLSHHWVTPGHLVKAQGAWGDATLPQPFHSISVPWIPVLHSPKTKGLASSW